MTSSGYHNQLVPSTILTRNNTRVSVFPMTPYLAFHAAYNILKNENAWTRGSYARTASGLPVADSHRPDAVAFCSVGVIRHVTGNDLNLNSRCQVILEKTAKSFVDDWYYRLPSKEREKTQPTLPCWQDHPATKHEDIVHLFKMATCASALMD